MDTTEGAFPFHWSDGTHQKGITKREYFAGLAMQALLQSPNCGVQYNSDKETIAQMSDSYAIRILNEMGIYETW